MRERTSYTCFWWETTAKGQTGRLKRSQKKHTKWILKEYVRQGEVDRLADATATYLTGYSTILLLNNE